MTSGGQKSEPGVRGWSQKVASLLKALGQDRFYPRLFAWLAEYSTFDYPQIWLFKKDRPPYPLYFEIGQKAQDWEVGRYIDGGYKLDPFYLTTKSDEETSGVYRLTEFFADDFQQSEFYLNYYAKCDSLDEVVFIVEIDADTCVQLAFVRRYGCPAFDDSDMQLFRDLEPLVSEMMIRHIQIQTIEGSAPLTSSSQTDVETTLVQAFELFGHSILSGREKDVLDLVLRGHTTNGIAERLSISVETIRQHKKSIYRKLDVNSQAELFSLFLGSLSCVAPYSTTDPLATYNTPQKGVR